MVDGFFCFPIGAVPGPVMDSFAREPCIGNAEAGDSAEAD